MRNWKQENNCSCITSVIYIIWAIEMSTKNNRISQMRMTNVRNRKRWRVNSWCWSCSYAACWMPHVAWCGPWQIHASRLKLQRLFWTAPHSVITITISTTAIAADVLMLHYFSILFCSVFIYKRIVYNKWHTILFLQQLK